MRWARNLLKSEFIYRIFAFLAAQYIRLVFFTSKWESYGQEIPESYIKAQKPFIVCFWHGRLGMLACAWTWKNYPFRMLLSAHRDGQLIGKTVAYFGINSIAGSTQKGGTQALRELIKALRAGETIGITPDGPRGPHQIASLGVITLAKLANVDMIPITFSTSRRVRLSTWDRFHLALPFSRGIFEWGRPIPPPSSGEESDMEATRLHLETRLTNLQNKADHKVGLTIK